MKIQKDTVIALVSAYLDLAGYVQLDVNEISMTPSQIARDANLSRQTVYKYLQANVGWVQTVDGWVLSRRVSRRELLNRAALSPARFEAWWLNTAVPTSKAPANNPAPVGLKKEHAEIVEELVEYLAERKDVEVPELTDKLRDVLLNTTEAVIKGEQAEHRIKLLANIILFSLESE